MICTDIDSMRYEIIIIIILVIPYRVISSLVDIQNLCSMEGCGSTS